MQCHARWSVALSLCLTLGAAQAQVDSQATITPNYKDADLSQITEAVSAVTGKTFIIDPRVKAQVTMLSSTPMSANAFYQAYLSILQVHGYAAVTAGNVIKIIPDANARSMPGNDLPGSVSSASDELVTQVLPLRSVSAAQLVPILRPLVAQNGNLVAYAQSNMLIITDRANNVNRIMRIIDRIDRASDDDIEVVQLQNATAAEIVKVVNALNTPTAGQPAEATQGVKIVGDDRTNSILVSGDKSQRLRIKTLITYLDTPLQSGGNTQVRYLQYADAEDIAKKLKEQSQGITQATAGAPPAGGGAAPTSISASAGANQSSIWADKNTNALIVSAPPKVMQQLMSIVDKLDIRRAQVQVEAIVVEVSANKTSELGINWALYGSGSSSIPAALFSGGTNPITSIASAVASEDYTSLPSGTTVGVGRLVDSGGSFAAILRALQEDAQTNIVSTPSIITMDNQEASIEVTQQVPLLTGQYTTSTSSNTSSGVNPFQTVQRQDVGTKLKITPQINQGSSVLLTIAQEASSLSQDKGDAGSLITNKRSIATKVLVENGGTVVLGGLLEDNLTGGEARVPVLGSIPIIGNFFKTRNAKKSKTNLMVFIRPTILRDDTAVALETNAKYNWMRDMQVERGKEPILLQPGEKQPLLPEISPPPSQPVTQPSKTELPAEDAGLRTAPLPAQPAPASAEPVTP